MNSRQLVVAAILVDDLRHPTRVLAARRSAPPALAGRWEFPGGKVGEDESVTDALIRELREELGVQISVGAELPPRDGPTWPISGALELRTWWAEVSSGTPEPRDSLDEVVWLDPADLMQLDWLDADQPIATAVRRRLLPAL